MRVDFLIFFLLIASPVKKEDACQTSQEPHKFIALMSIAGAEPTVTTDASVKQEYEYGDDITLKWSIHNMQGYKTKFDLRLTLETPHFEHEHQVRCNDPPTIECSEYRLPELLEPGTDYTWKLQFTFSKHGESIDREISGHFTVKKPSNLITVLRPIKDHEYQQGQDVVLEWSMPYKMHEITGLKIWVWEKMAHDDAIPCKDFINENQCKLPPLLPSPSYRWTIQAVSPHGQPIQCQVDGSFTIVQKPTLQVEAPIEATYEYENKDKIIIRWAIYDPAQIVRKYEVWLWNTNGHTSIMFTPECANIHKCNELQLPPQKPGSYQCVVKVVSRFKITTRSEIFCDFVVEPDDKEPGEFCGDPKIKGNVRRKRLAFEKPHGKDAVAHSWPWVGLLKFDTTEPDQNECMVNLIQVKGNKKRSDVLVTSGKCITTWESDTDDPDSGHTIEIDAEKLQVVAGIHSTSDSIEPIQIVQVRKHDKYEQTKHGHSHLYDVGLVRVKPPIDFDDDDDPVCSAGETDPVPEKMGLFGSGWKCVVAGFETADKPNRSLKQMIVELQTNTYCKNSYTKFDEELMMCGLPPGQKGFLSKKTKLTFNDNGASVHCFDESTSKWRLYGTVTMSDRDVTNSHPFFFTRFKGEIAKWVSETADEMSWL